MSDGSAKTARTPEVEEQADSIDSSITGIEKEINCLQERLESVSRPRPPENESDKDMVPQKPLVPLAERMRGLCMRIEKAKHKLMILLDTIEL